MFKRIPQPPVQPELRDPERHDFWPGFIAGLIGLVLVVAGARHLTGVETVDGGAARETQLIKAFSVGGLRYADRMAPLAPPLPTPGDPAATAAALDRWAQQRATAAVPAWKIRVDIGAVTPCPT